MRDVVPDGIDFDEIKVAFDRGVTERVDGEEKSFVKDAVQGLLQEREGCFQALGSGVDYGAVDDGKGFSSQCSEADLPIIFNVEGCVLVAGTDLSGNKGTAPDHGDEVAQTV